MPRHNTCPMAEQVGERAPDGVQRLMDQTRWDPDAVRDDLQRYVVVQLGGPQAMLEYGVPEAVEFAAKPQLARKMLERAVTPARSTPTS